MDVSFVLITQDYTQRAIPLNRPRTIIGRQTDCQIRIPTADVSRQHCEVQVEGDAVSIRDMGSSNGTFVNRKKISQTTLSAGDLISVGSCVFVVRLNGDPANIDAEDAYEDGAVATAATAGGAEAPTVVSRPAAPPAARPAAKPAPSKSLLDDEAKNDDSDAFDFDFSDDEDEKKKPKR